MALDWLLVVATMFAEFQLLGAFVCNKQILQVEILLCDQVQDMLAWTLEDSTVAADP
jgi:hypothetical protein